MGRQYIVGDAEIRIVRRAAFAVAFPGQSHLQVMTVAQALKPNRRGANSFDTVRGTIDVRAELVIPHIDPRATLAPAVHIDRKYNLCYTEEEGCERG
jgi:hypothetical protein